MAAGGVHAWGKKGENEYARLCPVQQVRSTRLVLTPCIMQAQASDGRDVGVLLLVHVRSEIDRYIPPLILNQNAHIVYISPGFAAGGLSCTGRNCTP